MKHAVLNVNVWVGGVDGRARKEGKGVLGCQLRIPSKKQGLLTDERPFGEVPLPEPQRCVDTYAINSKSTYSTNI